MKLSEALILGDTLKHRRGWSWLSPNLGGELCGCALGGAFLATGGTYEDYIDHFSILEGFRPQLLSRWPWLTGKIIQRIGERYAGGESIEEIADWVRTIEPKDELVQTVSEEVLVEAK